MPEEKATLSKQPAPEKKPDAAKLPNAPPKTCLLYTSDAADELITV